MPILVMIAGVNGQVKYSIVQQPNQRGTKFTVDEETGELFTNKVILIPIWLGSIVAKFRLEDIDFELMLLKIKREGVVESTLLFNQETFKVGGWELYFSMNFILVGLCYSPPK